MRRPRDASVSLDDLLVGARLVTRLPWFLRHPVSLPEARTILRHRFEHRRTDFLHLVKHVVYGSPDSPYRPLLARAGCAYGDVERLVKDAGVEGALRALFREGVYLTVEELKGRRPVERGHLTLEVGATLLRNSRARAHLPLRSGGSRGSAVPMVIDLAFMRETNVNHCCTLDARGGAAWTHALWDVPGGAALIRLLRWSGIGAPPARWFSQIDPAAKDLHPRYRWSARMMRWAGWLAGVPLPAPVHVPLDEPLPIAHWLAGVLRAGGTPHLLTSASAGVRLCQAARAAGIELDGAELTISGEPITETRLAELRRSGVRALPMYGSSDTGTAIGHGCLCPAWADDLHLFHDLFAVIQPLEGGPPCGMRPEALLMTSLRMTAPLILLNVALGDQAVLTERSCGCPLERLGWGVHLHTVRSYEKLTAGGMNLLDADLIRVLDEVLPARFGGGPTHYQVVEEQTEDGHPCLRLLVDPAVGPLDTEAVAEAFLAAIAQGSGIERLTGLTWRAGGFVRVERRPPLSLRGDKVLHLHSAPTRRAQAGSAGQ